MLFLLALALLLLPPAEIYFAVSVGETIGVWPTVALLIVDSIAGFVLVRHQGRAAWARFSIALAEGRIPHREVADGFLVLLGGALLLTPGFMTDIVGFLLLLPPVRPGMRKVVGWCTVGRIPFVKPFLGAGRRQRAHGPTAGQGRPGRASRNTEATTSPKAHVIVRVHRPGRRAPAGLYDGQARPRERDALPTV